MAKLRECLLLRVMPSLVVVGVKFIVIPGATSIVVIRVTSILIIRVGYG
jgi:hypothetical protein